MGGSVGCGGTDGVSKEEEEIADIFLVFDDGAAAEQTVKDGTAVGETEEDNKPNEGGE